MSSKGRKVINAANIPCEWPVVPTLVLYLFLDRVDASGVVWGIIGTFVVLAWVLVAIDVFTREQLPPLDDIYRRLGMEFKD